MYIMYMLYMIQVLQRARTATSRCWQVADDRQDAEILHQRGPRLLTTPLTYLR